MTSQQTSGTSTEPAPDSRQEETGEQSNAAATGLGRQIEPTLPTPIPTTAGLPEVKESTSARQRDSSQVSSTQGGLSVEDTYDYPLPTLTFDRDVRPFLVGDMRTLANGVEGLIRNAVQRSHVQASSVVVTAHTYRNRRGIELKFTVFTRQNPDQAFALWDAIGLNVEHWRTRLPPRALRLLDEQITISVEWQ